MEKSKLIVPNRGKEKSEGQNLKAEGLKAAGNEQPSNEETKEGETKAEGGKGRTSAWQKRKENILTQASAQGTEAGAPNVPESSEANFRKPPKTDETDSTDGTEVKMGSVAEAEVATGMAETAAPALTAKQKAYNAWFQMLHYAIPFDETELERLNAEAEKEEGVEMKNEE